MPILQAQGMQGHVERHQPSQHNHLTSLETRLLLDVLIYKLQGTMVAQVQY
jgi:hypothetical protein